MSAQANIIAFDGAATPVTHTFVPIGTSVDPKAGEQMAMWREALATVPAYAQIRVTTKIKRMKTGIYRVVDTVEVPVMETVGSVNAAGYTSAPKVAYTNTISIVGYFSERSTINERRLARQLALNIAGSVTTSVVPVATGPIPELIDQFITGS